MRRSLVVSLLLIVLFAVGSFAYTLSVGNAPLLGLDLQGGVSVVLEPERKVASGILEQSKDIIERRVNALGVAEPDIAIQGDAIVVQLPGVKDQDRALKIINQTAELRFRPVIGQVPTSESAKPPTTTTTTTPATTGSTDVPTPTPTTAPEPVNPKTTPRDEDDPDKPVVLPQRDRAGEVSARFQLGPAELTGSVIRTAQASFNAQTGEWAVDFKTTGKGATEFDEMAARHVGKQVAIVLDGVVLSAPVFQTASFNGEGQITGDFTEREAKDLALSLRYGALPVELEPLQTERVSATLGTDSLRAGVIAGMVGLGLVLLYMILYYRALGIVVFFGLIVSGMLMWTIVSFLGETSGLALTLAGATGIIISVGVTVDSYVVYFERLKDEIRAGKTIRSSVDRGFARAFRTILAADTVSFIGAFLLWWLTVGPVRGFAFFLGLSTALDVVIAYCFTRPMVVLLGRNRLFTEARWLGVARGLAITTDARTGAPA